MSLINMWEFAITVEPLYGFSDYFQHGNHSPFPLSHPYGNGFGGYGGYGGGVMGGGHPANYRTNSNNNAATGNIGVSTVLRAQIKKIARNCVGRNGRVGAVFERGGLESLSDDPLLREQPAGGCNEDGGADAAGAAPSSGQGKWRTPLGAYHPLMTYLTSPLASADGRGSRNVVGGITPRAAQDGHPRAGAHGQEGARHRRRNAIAERRPVRRARSGAVPTLRGRVHTG